jgi:Zinc carboxypeptidase
VQANFEYSFSFVTAGLSARDWISMMSAIDIMHELVEHYEDFRHLVDDVEWFIIPCANPVS